MTDSPEALFAALVETAPARPFVTYYDEATGERSELSARSAANWVAKTHFLLTDELGLGVGDAAYVDLPAHWISAPVLLGCWTAGLSVTTGPAQAAAAFVTAETAGGAKGVADTYAVAPEQAARGFTGATPPAGTSDYVAAVRPQPDAWATVHPPASPGDPALDDVPRADLVAKARACAGELGMQPGARVLVTPERPEWVGTLLAALTVGGSLVIVRGASSDVLARRAEQERATPLP
jgi:uncharacterized protein (TIGR03089 family)